MSSSKAALGQYRAKARAAWHGLAPRERRAVGLVGVVLATALTWLTLVEPALAKIDHWQAETPKLRSQAQALSELLAQAPQTPNQPTQDIEPLHQSLADAGLAQCCTLQAADAGWQLTWQQAPAEAALDWLTRVPPQHALQVSAAHLQRDPQPDPAASSTLSGTLRLDHALGAKESP